MFATPALALLLISPDADPSGWPAFLPPPALARLTTEPPRLADRSVEEIVDAVLPFEAYHGGGVGPEESRRIAEALGRQLRAKMQADAVEKFGPFDGLKDFKGLEPPVVLLADGVDPAAAAAAADLLTVQPDPTARTRNFSVFDQPNFRIRRWRHRVVDYKTNGKGDARLVLRNSPDVLERHSNRVMVWLAVEEVWGKKAGGPWTLHRSYDATKGFFAYELH